MDSFVKDGGLLYLVSKSCYLYNIFAFTFFLFIWSCIL